MVACRTVHIFALCRTPWEPMLLVPQESTQPRWGRVLSSTPHYVMYSKSNNGLPSVHLLICLGCFGVLAAYDYLTDPSRQQQPWEWDFGGRERSCRCSQLNSSPPNTAHYQDKKCTFVLYHAPWKQASHPHPASSRCAAYDHLCCSRLALELRVLLLAAT